VGITLAVSGDANDYFGKGLSGGVISVRPMPEASYKFDENVIVGNVALMGATSGRMFVNGLAGQRFAVRNSGATAVVEGLGMCGCEYMTGGCVLVLGEVGQNFAAGMTGGVAYVFDERGTLRSRIGDAGVACETPTEGDLARIRALIEEHVERTQSPRGIKLLYQFPDISRHFVKVIPREYERVCRIVAEAEAGGATHEEALETAFQAVTAPAATRAGARSEAVAAGICPPCASAGMTAPTSRPSCTDQNTTEKNSEVRHG